MRAVSLEADYKVYRFGFARIENAQGFHFRSVPMKLGPNVVIGVTFKTLEAVAAIDTCDV